MEMDMMLLPDNLPMMMDSEGKLVPIPMPTAMIPSGPYMVGDSEMNCWRLPSGAVIPLRKFEEGETHRYQVAGAVPDDVEFVEWDGN